MKKLSNEQILEVILRAGIAYEVVGLEIMVECGELTQEAFNNKITQENLMAMAENQLHDARTHRKTITAENTERVLEIKHINFLGNETIEKRKQNAVNWAIKNFS